MGLEMKLICTAGIQMKWRCDHRSCNHNFEAIANFDPKKILGRQRDSKP